MSDFGTAMTEIALKLQIHALKRENAALRGELRRLKEYLLDPPVYSNEDSNCGVDLRSEEDRDGGKYY